MNAPLPEKSENPNGLHRRYIVQKANGEPTDPRAIYFVLRLDGYGDDPLHVEACRWAARMWAENAPQHLRKVAKELMALLDSFKEKPTGGEKWRLTPPDRPGIWECNGVPCEVTQEVLGRGNFSKGKWQFIKPLE